MHLCALCALAIARHISRGLNYLTIPNQHGLSAISSRAFFYDMGNVHFYRVFRQVEFVGDQLVGKTEVQRFQDVHLARREVKSVWRIWAGWDRSGSSAIYLFGPIDQLRPREPERSVDAAG